MAAALVISIVCVQVFLCFASGLESLSAPAPSSKSTSAPPSHQD
ncbi:MAG: hypothetical protein ACYC92_12720 [Candidatus Acidiferrales bacterium]